MDKKPLKELNNSTHSDTSEPEQERPLVVQASESEDKENIALVGKGDGFVASSEGVSGSTTSLDESTQTPKKPLKKPKKTSFSPRRRTVSIPIPTKRKTLKERRSSSLMLDLSQVSFVDNSFRSVSPKLKQTPPESLPSASEFQPLPALVPSTTPTFAERESQQPFPNQFVPTEFRPLPVVFFLPVPAEQRIYEEQLKLATSMAAKLQFPPSATMTATPEKSPSPTPPKSEAVLAIPWSSIEDCKPLKEISPATTTEGPLIPSAETVVDTQPEITFPITTSAFEMALRSVSKPCEPLKLITPPASPSTLQLYTPESEPIQEQVSTAKIDLKPATPTPLIPTPSERETASPKPEVITLATPFVSLESETSSFQSCISSPDEQSKLLPTTTIDVTPVKADSPESLSYFTPPKDPKPPALSPPWISHRKHVEHPEGHSVHPKMHPSVVRDVFGQGDKSTDRPKPPRRSVLTEFDPLLQTSFSASGAKELIPEEKEQSSEETETESSSDSLDFAGACSELAQLTPTSEPDVTLIPFVDIPAGIEGIEPLEDLPVRDIPETNEDILIPLGSQTPESEHVTEEQESEEIHLLRVHPGLRRSAEKPPRSSDAALEEYYKGEMTTYSDEVNKLKTELSDVKLKLNAAERQNFTRELEMKKREEIFLKNQAEALKNEQAYISRIKQLEDEQSKENLELIEKDTRRELEERLKEATAREAKAKAELQNIQKDFGAFSAVIREFETTMLKKAADYEKLQEDHITIKKHLANLELAFSDLHSKYEKTKETLVNMKENEEVLIQTLADCQQLTVTQDEKYESLKSHAKSQIEKSNRDIMTLKKEHGEENANLKGKLKSLEIQYKTLEDALQRKTKECEQLATLVEELTTFKKA